MWSEDADGYSSDSPEEAQALFIQLQQQSRQKDQQSKPKPKNQQSNSAPEGRYIVRQNNKMTLSYSDGKPVIDQLTGRAMVNEAFFEKQNYGASEWAAIIMSFGGLFEETPLVSDEPALLPQISKSTTDDFLEAAETPDRNGLTQSGRALQKHGNRSGSAYPKVPQNPGSLNSNGLKIVEDILSSPNKTVKPNKYGGNDIIDNITGKGVRMDKNGKVGFLEPNYETNPHLKQ